MNVQDLSAFNSGHEVSNEDFDPAKSNAYKALFSCLTQVSLPSLLLLCK